MFRFNCAHCGRPEILHYSRGELQEYDASGLWPDEECQEDPPMKLGEGTLAEMLECAEGCQITVLECPGFRYQDGDRDDVIQVFAEASSRQSWIKEYVPDDWQADLSRAIEAMEARDG